MEILQLRYFLTAAKHGNITKAAQELNISQPSLSKTLSKLEESLDAKLFDRKGKRVFLNEAGKVFEKRVQKMFSDMDQARLELADITDAKKRRIIIGSTIARLMPRLLRGFLENNPDTLFNLVQVTNHRQIEQKLFSGEIDICFSILPVELPGAVSVDLINDEIIAAVSKKHRLAEKKSVKLAEIADDPMVYYSAETGLRNICDSFFAKAGLKPDIAFECSTPDIICGLAGAGFGNALIPSSWTTTVDTAQLSLMRIADFHCKRTVRMSWITDRYTSKATEKFIRYSEKYFHSIE